METITIIAHFESLEIIKEMIVAEAHRVQQLENLKNEKSWLFYSHDEIVSEKLKYSHQIEIHTKALERLKQYYTNKSKLN